MIDTYYEKANQLIKGKKVEDAITAFLFGIDHGSAKCAYGVVDTVMRFKTYTMTVEEAISIFSAAYPELKLLAEAGDTEAMVMVAQGIRYGFVDDEEDPYSFWLTKAIEFGNEEALAIMQEIDESFDPMALPCAVSTVTEEARSCMDDTDLLLMDEPPEFDEDLEPSEEHVLLEDADWTTFEMFDVNHASRRKTSLFELLKSDPEFFRFYDLEALEERLRNEIFGFTID